MGSVSFRLARASVTQVRAALRTKNHALVRNETWTFFERVEADDEEESQNAADNDRWFERYKRWFDGDAGAPALASRAGALRELQPTRHEVRLHIGRELPLLGLVEHSKLRQGAEAWRLDPLGLAREFEGFE